MLLDRRRHSRQTVDPHAYVDLVPNNAGWLSNISEGGLALDLFFPAVSGQAVRLGFGLPGTHNRIEANCQITWIDKSGRKAGLRFLDLPEASHQRIREWLSARTPSLGGRLEGPGSATPNSASRRTGTFLILVLLVISLVVLYPFVQKWLVGTLRSVPPTEATATQNLKVWAVKQTGLYYCPDSKLYQKVGPGMLMTQEKALEGGYRPAGGETCR